MNGRVPGAVDTEMLRRANPALRPGLTSEDVINAWPLGRLEEFLRP